MRDFAEMEKEAEKARSPGGHRKRRARCRKGHNAGIGRVLARKKVLGEIALFRLLYINKSNNILPYWLRIKFFKNFRPCSVRLGLAD